MQASYAHVWQGLFCLHSPSSHCLLFLGLCRHRRSRSPLEERVPWTHSISSAQLPPRRIQCAEGTRRNLLLPRAPHPTRFQTKVVSNSLKTSLPLTRHRAPEQGLSRAKVNKGFAEVLWNESDLPPSPQGDLLKPFSLKIVKLGALRLGC